MDAEDVTALTNFLTKGIYPRGLCAREKHNFRQKAAAFFCQTDADGKPKLYHCGKSRTKRQLVIHSADEKQQIIHFAHFNMTAGIRDGEPAPHCGRNTTFTRISEHYWWRRMVEDVSTFCKNCTACSSRARAATGSFPQIPVDGSFPQLPVDGEAEVAGNCHVFREDPIFVAATASGIPTLMRSPITYVTKNSPSYPCDLLAEFRGLQEQQLLCDLILATDDGLYRIPVHKIVLVAVSTYFRSLILDPSLAFPLDFITVPNVSGECLEAIASFLYSGTLLLSTTIVQEILKAATYLEIPAVVDLCHSYMECLHRPQEPDGKLTARNVSVNATAEGRKIKTEVEEEENEAADDADSGSDTDCGISNGSEFETKPVIRTMKTRSSSNRQSKRRRSVTPVKKRKKRKSVAKKREKSTTRTAPSPLPTLQKVKSRFRRSAVVLPQSMSRSKTPSALVLTARHLLRSAFAVLRKSAVVANDRPFACRLCSSEHEEFKTRSQLAAHAVHAHWPSVRLVRHITLGRTADRSNGEGPTTSKPQPPRRRITKPQRGGGVKLFEQMRNRCGWCGIDFQHREKLMEHREQVHQRKGADGAPGTPRRDVVHRVFNCAEKTCGASFNKKNDLLRHMATVHPSVIFPCPKCQFKTQVEYIFRSHIAHRHRERHKCHWCGKAYFAPYLLRFHMYNRHRIIDPLLKLHHCPHAGCSYAYPTKDGIKQHVIKHKQANAFTCHQCGKSFKRLFGLDKHTKKFHLDTRSHICDKCGASFIDGPELRKHMVHHEGHKPFCCHICDFSTFKKCSLKVHLSSRHQVLMAGARQEFRCKDAACNYVTDSKSLFDDHVKIHQGVRDLPCPHCDKMFVTKSTLRQHVFRNHQRRPKSAVPAASNSVPVDNGAIAAGGPPTTLILSAMPNHGGDKIIHLTDISHMTGLTAFGMGQLYQASRSEGPTLPNFN